MAQHMRSADISCYDKDWEQITDPRKKNVHRYSGKNCCTGILGIGFSEKYGQQETDALPGGRRGAGRVVRHGPRSAEMGIGRHGSGSGKIQETGTE